jgi:tetratricopeptide (TPR) repeat protein
VVVPHAVTAGMLRAIYLHTRGEPASARSLRERALQLYRSHLGVDHPQTLQSASNLANDLWALGCYEQTRQLAEDTLTRYRRIVGDDHPDTLVATRDLAVVLASPGEHDQAPRGTNNSEQEIPQLGGPNSQFPGASPSSLR